MEKIPNTNTFHTVLLVVKQMEEQLWRLQRTQQQYKVLENPRFYTAKQISNKKTSNNQTNIENRSLFNRFSQKSCRWCYCISLFVQCLEHITFQTNLNATQQSQRKVRERFKPFFRNEIEEVIEINLLMGINKLPNWRIHCENLSKVLVISKAMTRNRLGDISPSLHYNDNTLKFNHSDPPMGISRKWNCENMQQSHRRIHMTKCDFNEVALQVSSIK